MLGLQTYFTGISNSFTSFFITFTRRLFVFFKCTALSRWMFLCNLIFYIQISDGKKDKRNEQGPKQESTKSTQTENSIK